tara:strand:+ start:129 stop:509 length:381 start_codon:yes stop_codon:yes gene_type:complete
MLHYGWEFFILNPLETITEEKTQDKYIKMYNKAYNTFLNQLCIPEPNELLEDDFDFMYYIDFDKENDTIELDENYEYKFLKSVFLEKKFKILKHNTTMYYKKYEIDVINFYINYKGLYIMLKKCKP